MDIQKFIKTIRIPLALEFFNAIVISLFRDHFAVDRLQALDMFTIAFTIAIFFYIGLRVAITYVEGRLITAAGMGLFLWFISTIIFTGGMGFALSVFSAPSDESVLAGPAIAFILFAPVAIVVPMLGAFLRTRYEIVLKNTRSAKT